MCLYIKDRFFSLNLVPLYMWTLIIIIDVVVVVDDDAYYWVYWSSDHLFQVYYKVRQALLQSATAFLLQSATSVVTKCDRYYKVWQFYYKVRQVLQSATIITRCDSTNSSSLLRALVNLIHAVPFTSKMQFFSFNAEVMLRYLFFDCHFYPSLGKSEKGFEKLTLRTAVLHAHA